MTQIIKKEKIQIEHDWFIPWILEDYGDQEIAEAWGSGVSIEDFCIGSAGLLPVQHIRNWEDIKHHFDDEPYNGKEKELQDIVDHAEYLANNINDIELARAKKEIQQLLEG